MFSSSKTDQFSARVSVRVPRPDSLVEVRVTPPDSSLQVEVSSGGEVIELRVRPGASLIEVRVSPPGEKLPEGLQDLPRHLNADERPPAEYKVFTGAGPAGVVGLGEEADSAEIKQLPDRMLEDEEAVRDQTVSGCRLPDEARKIAAPGINDEDEQHCLAAGWSEDKLVEFEWPYAVEPGNGELVLENGAVWGPELPTPTPDQKPVSSGPSFSQTPALVPVAPGVSPMKEYGSIAPEAVDAAALSALARLNQAVREEQAAIAKAFVPEKRPKPGEATIAADGFSGADCTIMVEMYDDGEFDPKPADAVAPLPEDEIMDLGQMEKEAELAVGPVDTNGLGEFDLGNSHLVELGDDHNMVKARPMARVIPSNTVVPE